MKSCAYCNGLVANEAFECPGCSARIFVEAPREIIHVGDDRIVARDVMPHGRTRAMQDLEKDYHQRLQELQRDYQQQLEETRRWYKESAYELL